MCFNCSHLRMTGRAIKNIHVKEIDQLVLRLEDEIQVIRDHAAELEDEIDSLVESLIDLNVTLVSDTPLKLSAIAQQYGDQTVHNIAVYIQWLKRQLRENLGACLVSDKTVRPLNENQF